MFEKYRLSEIELRKINEKIDKGGMTFDEQLNALVDHKIALDNYHEALRAYKKSLGMI